MSRVKALLMSREDQRAPIHHRSLQSYFPTPQEESRILYDMEHPTTRSNTWIVFLLIASAIICRGGLADWLAMQNSRQLVERTARIYLHIKGLGSLLDESTKPRDKEYWEQWYNE
jgi:hypothetical protein